MITQKDLDNLITRIQKLEDFVYKKKLINKNKSSESFSGATGGIRFLSIKKYFTNKHSLKEVRAELAKNGYHYSSQAIDIALSRASKPGNLLVALKEKGKKMYVTRK
jgi:hypothetical protein